MIREVKGRTGCRVRRRDGHGEDQERVVAGRDMHAHAVRFAALILKRGRLDRTGDAARIVAREFGELMERRRDVGQLADRFRIGFADFARHQLAHRRRDARAC